MPKGIPNKRYTEEFKKMVIETMQQEELSYRETARRFGVVRSRITTRERIYLEKGQHWNSEDAGAQGVLQRY